MIYIEYLKINDTKAFVTTRHYKPEVLTADEKKNGVVINNLPTEELVEGKKAVYYINPQTNIVWIEYEDIEKPIQPIDTEQEHKQVKEQISALNVAIAQLLGM